MRKDLLGSGALGAKPISRAVDERSDSLSPRANVAYQWNGKSVLANDVRLGLRGRPAGINCCTSPGRTSASTSGSAWHLTCSVSTCWTHRCCSRGHSKWAADRSVVPGHQLPAPGQSTQSLARRA